MHEQHRGQLCNSNRSRRAHRGPTRPGTTLRVNRPLLISIPNSPDTNIPLLLESQARLRNVGRRNLRPDHCSSIGIQKEEDITPTRHLRFPYYTLTQGGTYAWDRYKQRQE